MMHLDYVQFTNMSGDHAMSIRSIHPFATLFLSLTHSLVPFGAFDDKPELIRVADPLIFMLYESIKTKTRSYHSMASVPTPFYLLHAQTYKQKLNTFEWLPIHTYMYNAFTNVVHPMGTIYVCALIHCAQFSTAHVTPEN